MSFSENNVFEVVIFDSQIVNILIMLIKCESKLNRHNKTLVLYISANYTYIEHLLFSVDHYPFKVMFKDVTFN